MPLRLVHNTRTELNSSVNSSTGIHALRTYQALTVLVSVQPIKSWRWRAWPMNASCDWVDLFSSVHVPWTSLDVAGPVFYTSEWRWNGSAVGGLYMRPPGVCWSPQRRSSRVELSAGRVIISAVLTVADGILLAISRRLWVLDSVDRGNTRPHRMHRVQGCGLLLGLWSVSQGCSGAGTRGDGVPPLFSTGGRVPHSPTFLDWNSCKS